MSTATFGQLLKTEREDFGLSLQAVAERLRVDRRVLEALERNEFGALPDESSMDALLHEYADGLGLDADLMIADYTKEREKWLRARQAVPVVKVGEPPSASRPSARESAARPLWPVAAVGLVLLLLVSWWGLSKRGDEPAAPAPVFARVQSGQASSDDPETPAEPMDDPAPAVERQTLSEAPARELPASAPAVADEPVALPEEPLVPAGEGAPASATLSIRDYGVGTGVEDRELVGRGDRFRVGTQVWFWTRVLGGGRGESVHHVWLHEGREVMRRSMRIGSSMWRTYSALSLPVETPGAWAVEARDADGRPLARAEFVSVR